MEFISLETIMDLHDHMTAAVSDCQPTEALLLAALHTFAKERGLDPDALMFGYQVMGLVKRMERESPESLDLLSQLVIEEELAQFDPTEVN